MTNKIVTFDELNAIINSALDGIISFEALRDAQRNIVDFEITLCNKTAADIIQVPQSKLLGSTLKEMLPDHFTPLPTLENKSLFDLYVQIVEQASNKQFEHCIIEKGVRQWYSRRMVNFKDGFVMTFEVITERKREEEELKNAYESLNEAQRVARVGSWKLDLLENKLEWSDETYRIFGLKPQSIDASYEVFLNYTHPDDREKINHIYADSIKQKIPYQVMHRIINEQGETLYVQERAKHLTDENGEVIASIGTVLDITERVELEHELNRFNAELETKIQNAIEKIRQKDAIINQQSKRKAMDALLVEIAHHWRQPLNACALEIQNIEDLLDGCQNDQKIKQGIKKSFDELKSLSDTITKLTRFYETDAAQSVSLSKALEQLEELSLSSLRASGIKIEKSISDDFDIQAKSDLWVEVFSSILMNTKDVIKEKKLGGANVHIKATKESKESVITVEDDAGGIDQKLLPDKLFEPYVTTHFRVRDRGLGLYNVYNLITHRLHGSIEASNTAKGALFTIRIPHEQP